MQHLAVKASVTEATDQGTFEAIAASWSTDRTRERIVRGAFSGTIERWRKAGRDVPLAWDHGRDARDIIGSIDSSTMEERAEGLYVEGQLDIEDSEVAREAWRSLKRGRIGLSFGYKVDAERDGSDGVKELLSLDLFEVTLTSVPANADARILSAKSVDVPAELVGTAWDPAAATGGVEPWTKAQLIEHKNATKAKPIQVATFEC